MEGKNFAASCSSESGSSKNESETEQELVLEILKRETYEPYLKPIERNKAVLRRARKRIVLPFSLLR